MVAPQFISKEIDVTVDGDIKNPVSFRLDKTEYEITDIVESWPDYGFGRSVTGKKKWYQRHHRNYYRVRTTGGEVYEIYYDRGVNMKHPERRKWFVSRQL